jgi:hypothetical protein
MILFRHVIIPFDIRTSLQTRLHISSVLFILQSGTSLPCSFPGLDPTGVVGRPIRWPRATRTCVGPWSEASTALEEVLWHADQFEIRPRINPIILLVSKKCVVRVHEHKSIKLSQVNWPRRLNMISFASAVVWQQASGGEKCSWKLMSTLDDSKMLELREGEGSRMTQASTQFDLKKPHLR